MTFVTGVLGQTAVLALATMGLHVTFGLLGLVNLTHGAMILCGGYVAYSTLAASGSFLLAVVAALAATALVGAVLEVLLMRRLYDRVLDSLVVTFGITIVVRQCVQLAYGPDPRGFPPPLSGGLTVAEASVPWWQLVVLATAAVLTLLLHLTSGSTRLGLTVRAAVTNPLLARTSGIDVGAVRLGLFVVGSAAAGLAGAMLAPMHTLDTNYGLTLLVYSFFVVMLGGLGSLRGVWLASLTVAVVVVALQLVVSAVAAQVLAFLVILALIRIRQIGSGRERPRWVPVRRTRLALERTP